MIELIITRGLPGSGKTYYASKWVAEDPSTRACVNRDDLRSMIHDGAWIKGVTEPRIIAARDAVIFALLKRGVSVICSDTNLPQRTVRDLAQLAKRAGVELRVADFTHVPVETCIERDAKRDRTVGEQVIRDMHMRYLNGRDLPLPLPGDVENESAGVIRYEAKPGTPRAILVDIDGTVALMGDRSPYDESCVDKDEPNEPVIRVVRALWKAGHAVVVMSGRTEGCRDATVDWLEWHLGVPFAGPFMRAVGDQRKDSIVKGELFDAHVRDAYDVACVLDDRAQVVAMWRSLGLTVLQVADGDF